MTATRVALAPRTAVPRAAATRWALVRVETRRVLLHPIFLLGLAYMIFDAILLALGVGVQNLSAGAQAPDTGFVMVARSFVWIGAATAGIAAFLAVSRERRDAAKDVYEAKPATARVRTQATVLAAAAAALAGGAIVALVLISTVGWSGGSIGAGPDQTLRPLELVGAAPNLMLGTMLGVLIGSWTSRLWVAVVASIVLFAPFGLLSQSLAPAEFIPASLLSTLLWARGGGAPFVAFLGLIALFAAIALWRHDRRPYVAVIGLAGLSAVIASAVAVLLAAIIGSIALLWPTATDDEPIRSGAAALDDP